MPRKIIFLSRCRTAILSAMLIAASAPSAVLAAAEPAITLSMTTPQSTAAAATTSTAATPDSLRTTTTAGAISSVTTGTMPIVTVLLPLGAPSVLHASIIDANILQTIFALGCNNDSSTSSIAPSDISSSSYSSLTTTDNATTTIRIDPTCGYSPAITLTEGISTLIYTATPTDGAGSWTNPLIPPSQPTTIECLLIGAVLDPPYRPVPATEVLCTAKLPIADLGYLGSTTRLAASQISFVGVTVTAGGEKLAAVTAAGDEMGGGGATAGATMKSGVLSRVRMERGGVVVVLGVAVVAMVLCSGSLGVVL